MTDERYVPSTAPLQDDLPVAKTYSRPLSITVICIVGLLGALLVVPMVKSPMAAAIGAWYPPYLAISAAVGGVCMLGLWFMKRWAAYAYAGFVLLNQVVLLAAGRWTPLALLIPGIVVYFALKHSPRM